MGQLTSAMTWLHLVSTKNALATIEGVGAKNGGMGQALLPHDPGERAGYCTVHWLAFHDGCTHLGHRDSFSIVQEMGHITWSKTGNRYNGTAPDQCGGVSAQCVHLLANQKGVPSCFQVALDDSLVRPCWVQTEQESVNTPRGNLNVLWKGQRRRAKCWSWWRSAAVGGQLESRTRMHCISELWSISAKVRRRDIEKIPDFTSIGTDDRAAAVMSDDSVAFWRSHSYLTVRSR